MKRIGIVGFGSIAQRHLGNLRQTVPSAHITVCRLNASTEAYAEAMDKGADNVVSSLDALIADKPEMAVIAGPASTHVAMGLALAAHGADLFIEKPLSHDLTGVDELIELCLKRKRILMVAYNLRFLKSLRVMRQAVLDGAVGRVLYVRAEVGQHLADWRPHLDYRKSVSAQKALGGGALLELSHDIDYLLWTFGPFTSVYAHLARVSDLEVDVEDTAELLLTSSNGALISLHLDMVQRPGGRSCTIAGTEGTLKWHLASDRLELFCSRDKSWRTLSEPEDRSQMYVRELQHFLDCVLDRSQPSPGGEEGKRPLEVIAAARRSAAARSAQAI